MDALLLLVLPAAAAPCCRRGYTQTSLAASRPRSWLPPACSVPEGTQASATFLAKAAGVLAGSWVAHAVFARVDPAVHLTWLRKDGELVQQGDTIAEACGSARWGAAAARCWEPVPGRCMPAAAANSGLLAGAGRPVEPGGRWNTEGANVSVPSFCCPCAGRFLWLSVWHSTFFSA